MPGQSITAAYHSLIAAVIDRAIDDLKGIGPKCKKKEKDRAMAFVLSDTCEAYCLELMIDYERIRKEAVVFYQRLIAETDKITVRRKYTKRATKHFERVQVRKVIGKRRIATDKKVIAHS